MPISIKPFQPLQDCPRLDLCGAAANGERVRTWCKDNFTNCEYVWHIVLRDVKRNEILTDYDVAIEKLAKKHKTTTAMVKLYVKQRQVTYDQAGIKP